MFAWVLKLIKRYGPAEISGSITAFLSAWAAKNFGANIALVSITGTWGENLGFYGWNFIREYRDCQKETPQFSWWINMIASLRNIAAEFGPAEILDTFFLRPLLMSLGQWLLRDVNGWAWGFIAGKIAADIVFYVIADRCNEAWRAYLKRRQQKA